MNFDDIFSQYEIAIVNCPAELEGADVEYQDADKLLSGIVRDGKLIVETIDEVPEDTEIVWGRGHWVIAW